MLGWLLQILYVCTIFACFMKCDRRDRVRARHLKRAGRWQAGKRASGRAGFRRLKAILPASELQRHPPPPLPTPPSHEQQGRGDTGERGSGRGGAGAAGAVVPVGHRHLLPRVLG